MVTVSNVCDAMNLWADPSLAASWDNPGLLLGHRGAQVHRILTALDATEEVIDEAIALGADMIVTHHPMIFGSLKKINDDTRVGKRLLTLAEHKIALFAAHTNLDTAIGGTNEVLAALLGLVDVSPVDGEGENLLRVGYLPEKMSLSAFCSLIKEKLDIPAVRVAAVDPDIEVRKIAFCTGSASEYIAAARHLEADAFITGDLTYHKADDARVGTMAVIDAGHFPTERGIAPAIASYLEGHLNVDGNHVEVIASSCMQDAFIWM